MKFFYIFLWDLSTAAENLVVNKTKNCYLGKMQRGKFFASIFMISLLNQDFIFLGLREEKRNEQSQDYTNTFKVLMVKGRMLCGYFVSFFSFPDKDLRKSSKVKNSMSINYQLTPTFCMVLKRLFGCFLKLRSWPFMVLKDFIRFSVRAGTLTPRADPSSCGLMGSAIAPCSPLENTSGFVPSWGAAPHCHKEWHTLPHWHHSFCGRERDSSTNMGLT